MESWYWLVVHSTQYTVHSTCPLVQVDDYMDNCVPAVPQGEMEGSVLPCYNVTMLPGLSLHMKPITLMLITRDALMSPVRLDIFILPARHYHYQLCPPGYVRPESKSLPV